MSFRLTPQESSRRRTLALSKLQDRFESDIATVPESGCWIWMGRTRPNGYGVFSILRRLELAHRISFWLYRGAMQPGKQLDHLCRVKLCVNPFHLREVTARVNTLAGDSPTARNAKKTHCVNGHLLVDGNIYRYGRHRFCKTCNLERAKHYRKNRKGIK